MIIQKIEIRLMYIFGIIIVKKNNKYVIEYCSDDRIIAKEYELV